jgi:hypothetical protein
VREREGWRGRGEGMRMVMRVDRNEGVKGAIKSNKGDY